MSPMRKSVLAVFALAATAAVHAQRAEDRAVASFSKLRVDNGIDVHLTQSDREGLRVEVDGYALEDVVTEVVDGELRLSRARSAGGWRFGRSRVSVDVSFVEVAALQASGGSDIDGRGNLKLDELSVVASGGSDIDLSVQATRIEFTVSGGSDLELRGSAESLTIVASGGSDVSATGLQAARIKLVASGGSDANVYATEAIEVNASGGSDVRISGDPQQRNVNADRSSDVSWR
jgi:Putative auto-transporter adhesin, head GIN domain